MEAGISAGQGRGESTGVFRGLTLKPLCFDEQGQNKYSTGYGSLGTSAYFRVPRWFAILQVVHTVHAERSGTSGIPPQVLASASTCTSMLNRSYPLMSPT